MPTKLPESLVKAQKNYKDRNATMGMARVTLWIPRIYEPDIKQVAADMRMKFKEDRKRKIAQSYNGKLVN